MEQYVSIKRNEVLIPAATLNESQKHYYMKKARHKGSHIVRFHL